MIQTAFFLAVTRAVPENIADTVWADAKVEQEDIDRAFGKLKLTGVKSKVVLCLKESIRPNTYGAP